MAGDRRPYAAPSPLLFPFSSPSLLRLFPFSSPSLLLLLIHSRPALISSLPLLFSFSRFILARPWSPEPEQRVHVADVL